MSYALLRTEEETFEEVSEEVVALVDQLKSLYNDMEMIVVFDEQNKDVKAKTATKDMIDQL